MAKNAKQILHEFFQQRPQFGKPVYLHQQQISPDGELRFSVSLDISGVRAPSGTPPPARFLGTAKQKKLGEHAAAEEAVRWLVNAGLLHANVLSSMAALSPTRSSSSNAVVIERSPGAGFSPEAAGQTAFRSPAFVPPPASTGPGYVLSASSSQLPAIHTNGQFSIMGSQMSVPATSPADVTPLPAPPATEVLSDTHSLEDVEYMAEEELKECFKKALLQIRDYKRYTDELLKRLKDVENLTNQSAQLSATASRLLAVTHCGEQQGPC